MPETRRTDTPDIRIPAGLLPSDGRFGSGPSKVRPEQVAGLADVATTYLGTSHRQRPVKSVVGRVRGGLAELFSLPDGYEVVLGNGGTTCFWDAATFGLIEPQSQHLRFGEFSSKFAAAAAAAPHLRDPQVIESEAGTHPLPVGRRRRSTSTPSPTTRPRPGWPWRSAGPTARPRRRTAAVWWRSTPPRVPAACGSTRPSSTSTTWPRRSASPPTAGCGWRSARRPPSSGSSGIAASGRWVPAFLDLKIALDNSRLDQTYNTPALATLFLLAEQLDWMLGHGGLEWTAGRCDRSAEILYTWAEQSDFARPFVTSPADRSHVVGTIDFVDAVDAAKVAEVLRANGIVDTEPYRKLGRNQLRIAMFPAVDPDDVAALCACITHVVGALAA